VSPIFYALRQSQIAVAASLAAIAVNVVLSVSLAGSMGFRGLALATSIAALASGGLLVLLLRRRLQGIEARRLTIVLTKVLAAAAAMAVAAWGIEYLMTGLLPGQRIAIRGVRLLAAIGGGLLVLVLAAKTLRIDELEDALGMLGGQLTKTRDA